jgi:hypothetical protein
VEMWRSATRRYVFADFDFRGEFGYRERGGWRQALLPF